MAKKKAATPRRASITVSSVKKELDEATRRLEENEQSQSDMQAELDSLRDELAAAKDEIHELKQRPEFDASSLDPMKTDLEALSDRAEAAETRLAEAEARTKEANDSAASASSSAGHAARGVDQVRANLQLTWGVALVLAIIGYFCWNDANDVEKTKTPAVPQITSGDLLAININGDDGEEQRVYAEVQVDGTIQDVSDETRLNVAGLEAELARRLVEAHVQSVIPMATVSLRTATDDEVAMWKSMKSQQEDEEREVEDEDDDGEQEEEEEEQEEEEEEREE